MATELGLSQFIETDPQATGINALISSSQVIGLTVSVTDCGLNNYQRSLRELSTITINGFNNNQPISINSIVAREGWYYYEVEPFSFSSAPVNSTCLDTTLNPFIEAIGFENSDFNILFNNASSSRASTYIQDVDRASASASGSINPTNILNLLEDTALRAQIPDSYYTSLAHTSGRYVGSKTSIEEYGVESAIGATIFSGTINLLSKGNTSICSGSTDTSIEEYLFSPQYITPGKLQGNFSYDSPQIRYEKVTEKRAADRSFSSTDTIMGIHEDVDVHPGEILRKAVGTELMRVIKVTKTVPYPGAPITSSIEVERNVYGDYIGGSLTSWVGGDLIQVVKIKGDIIYDTDSSKPYRVVEKKVFIEDTSKIYLTDRIGSIVSELYTCP